MSQLTLEIKNDEILEKVLWMLEHFKDDGVIIKSGGNLGEKNNYTEEYMKKNWKELLMNCKSDPNYYKSEQYYEDRGNYLMEKYS